MSVPSMSRTAMVGSVTCGRYPASPCLTALFSNSYDGVQAARCGGTRSLSAGQAAECLGNGHGAVLAGDPGSEVACPLQVGRAGSGVAKCGGEGGNGEPPKGDRPGPDPEGGDPRGPE